MILRETNACVANRRHPSFFDNCIPLSDARVSRLSLFHSSNARYLSPFFLHVRGHTASVLQPYHRSGAHISEKSRALPTSKSPPQPQQHISSPHQRDSLRTQKWWPPRQSGVSTHGPHTQPSPCLRVCVTGIPAHSATPALLCNHSGHCSNAPDFPAGGE